MLKLGRAFRCARPLPAKARFQSTWKGSARVNKIRNVGICAHVDAGKTTTTERILFYAKKIRAMGDVDQGDTHMDFEEQERERGITIKSACVTLGWNGHRINLIDTPGHVDFTVEVERAVRVLDGAVTVFDAVKGVEAQSETVWRQCDRYRVPRVAFINKMDREGASMSHAVSTIQQRLGANTLVLQLPVGQAETFTGVIDLLDMSLVDWPTAGSGSGTDPITHRPLEPSDALWDEAQAARERLIEQLAELDEQVTDIFLSEGADSEKLTRDVLIAAVRRATLAQTGVPVLCGSAFRKRGVQPLLDAIVDYFPSPAERPIQASLGTPDAPPIVLHADEKQPLCALAFKVVHDPQTGPIVFTRVYSGVLRAKDQLLNSSQSVSQGASVKERPLRVLEIDADSHADVDNVQAGDIAALVGLKHTRTGDTLVSGGATRAHQFVLPGITLPDPVFYCSVEAPSQAAQDQLSDALANLQREDPSVHVSSDPDTGQTLLRGMGELHLDIVRHRLANHYKVAAELGRMRVSYRETITDQATRQHTMTLPVAGKPSFASLTIRLEPAADSSAPNSVHWEMAPPEPGEHPLELSKTLQDAAQQGIQNALSRGALLGYPLVGVRLTVTACGLDADSTAAAFRACGSRATSLALAEAGPVLLEPIMLAEVDVSSEHAGPILADLSSRRRGHVRANTGSLSGARAKLTVEVPLAEMIGYSTEIRSRTQGTGSFSMEPLHYAPVPPHVQRKLIDSPTY